MSFDLLAEELAHLVLNHCEGLIGIGVITSVAGIPMAFHGHSIIFFIAEVIGLLTATFGFAMLRTRIVAVSKLVWRRYRS